ncbi:hypothetical protein NLA05_20035 [Xanthomonas citri pv. anacardii]|uniref:hypothetical protein n=1 Tax=Xanthomonas citri TaxID=346 RepID=UPI000CCC45C0|nr:hypothetical protein [Xanthomonas citri]MCT8358741.1 hypothetical protein [Xanthomonas citri pv. anacardii]MCT8362572.1 hypothetical protein [Xanthomonas citri pv. anacardii]MCT8366614.1 hypothetical protein [Xanthomonas citri pv. anacardii]MCT8370646.1 hypothetical protein [Xanthomonas citri pv. anacardii]MCT8374647.1 hypothetical protein [Xanthomonas citri pv. anacardii]
MNKNSKNIDTNSAATSPVDDDELHFRDEVLTHCVEEFLEKGFGLDPHLEQALDGYRAGRYDMPALQREIMRPYLH